uniref:Uncharacterized protein n=1 Tax=Sphaerodactylus townsendi TaxID=933632 RepID=A0ACB8GCM5_9SAUR
MPLHLTNRCSLCYLLFNTAIIKHLRTLASHEQRTVATSVFLCLVSIAGSPVSPEGAEPSLRADCTSSDAGSAPALAPTGDGASHESLTPSVTSPAMDSNAGPILGPYDLDPPRRAHWCCNPCG